MAEQSQGNNGRERAPLRVEEQEKEMRDKAPNISVEAAHATSGIVDPSSAKVMDSSPAEAVEPLSQDPQVFALCLNR